MTFESSLSDEINNILDYKLQIKHINHVPTKKDLTYSDDAFILNTSVLFADIRASSVFADEHRKETTAKVINAFLNCATRIIKYNDGEIRSFNGDSILAIFEPTPQSCENAVLASFNLMWAVNTLLRPAIRRKRYSSTFDIGIGISSGDILCTKVGIRGEDNHDLIWPSTCTNLAAKMGNYAKRPSNIIICKNSWINLPPKLKFNKKPMWRPIEFTFAQKRISVYQQRSDINL